MDAGPPIKSRAEAATWLSDQGLYAAERSWSLGESLVVGSGQAWIDTDPPIGLIQDAHCVFLHDGRWSTQRLGASGLVDSFESLDAAVRTIARVLSASSSI
jgi:hypothetical protein